MPELTSAPDAAPAQTPGAPDASRRPLRQQPWVPVAAQAVAVLVLFALAGLGAGWLWQHLWNAPNGVVVDHTWYIDKESGLRQDFAGTGLYVVIALGAGLVVGAVVAVFFDRAELVTLAAVTVGSVLAAWLMWKVGVHSSAVDPHEAAKTAADGTKLSGNLHVSGSGRFSLHWQDIRVPAAYLAFPVGALSSLAVVFMGLAKRGRGRV